MPRPRFNCYTGILIVVCGALFVVHFSPLKYHECDNVNLNANQLKQLHELQSTTTSSVVSATQNTILSELLKQSYTKGYGACPKVSPMLRGSVGIRLKEEGEANWPPTFEEIAHQNQRLQNGGFYPGPEDCEARSSIAIIIPYRDREDHLRYLLHYLHGILQRQQSKYIVVVVEQDDQNTFNKGLLMNIGFRYVTNNSTNFRPNCVFFHDVDSLSEDDRTLYNCTGGSKVVHLSSRMDKFDYRWCCGVTVGGVLGM
uniref:Galactosyltransferase N-terminal domain-containing protein n=1 Tax=Ciona savignyi TaxID=51511 RepID=H2ZJ93_CIOSA